VLARRIFYFRDRFFAARELPPPSVPKLDVGQHGQLATPACAATADAEQGTTDRRVQPFTSHTTGGDLNLDDFSFDFGDVVIPAEQLSDGELRRHADEFMARILD